MFPMPAVSPFVLLATAMAFAMAPGARAATPAGAVASPDGARAVAVETRAPVSYGDSTDFATRLVVRVDDTGPTASAGGMRRVVEASQVRSVGAPVWLGADSPWTAFTYDIQKNSSGLVYLDTSSGRGCSWSGSRRRAAWPPPGKSKPI